MRTPSDNHRSIVEPFLKWAGGKRWLTSYLKSVNLDFSGKYIEPFLGGGAVYFYLQPRRAILSDLNRALIEAYQCVRDDPDGIENLLKAHHKAHNTEHYYAIRSANALISIERAANLIYLNRTCWNGLYRVNKNGKFNVPIGTKSSVVLSADNWADVSALLSGAQIVARDFEASIDAAEAGDFLFVDPPYTVKHNFNGFVKYNESLFSWGDQVRLHVALQRAKERGVKMVITNADHQSIRDLYSSGFEFVRLERSSVLSGDSNFRGRYSELVITLKA